MLCSASFTIFVLADNVADELLPRYLGFIKGVVDSDSLPLNVSREMLQQNKVLKVIGKKMTRKALAMIKSMADAEKRGDGEDDEDNDEEKEAAEESKDGDEESKYTKFWKAFGKYIKMGLIEDAANRTRLAKLLRYATSKSGDKEISLEDYVRRALAAPVMSGCLCSLFGCVYTCLPLPHNLALIIESSLSLLGVGMSEQVANMKEDQKNIYYISGEDKDSLLKSPSVEKLRVSRVSNRKCP